MVEVVDERIGQGQKRNARDQDHVYSLLAARVQNFGMLVMDTEGRITAWNAGAERITGWHEDEVRGQSASFLFTPEDRAVGADKAEIEAARARNTSAPHEGRWYLKKDGSRFFAEGSTAALEDEAGALTGFGMVLRDVTDRKSQDDARDTLIALHQRTSGILESISDAFFAVDSTFRFTYVNRRAASWWNRSCDELVGRQIWSELPQTVGGEAYTRHQEAMASRQPVQFESVSVLTGRWFDVNIYPLDDGGLTVSFRDITERKDIEQRLSEASTRLETLSFQDGLTGISNRRALDARLAAACEEADRYRTPLSFLLLDIDHFKRFNDAHGHLAGDDVLKNVAAFLSYTVRGSDFLARYGGEEFAVVLPHTKADAALRMARRICRRMEAATLSPLREITASIGVATWISAMDAPNDLIDAADHALYFAKRQRNTAVHILHIEETAEIAEAGAQSRGTL